MKLWWPAVVISGLHINCTPLCSQRCTFICILLSSFPFPQYDYSLYGMREEIVQRIGEQQTKYRFSHLFFQLLDKIRFPSEHMLCYPNLGSGKGWRRGCRSWVASDWIKLAPDSRKAPPMRWLRGKLQPIGYLTSTKPIPRNPRRERMDCWHITLITL